MALGEIRCEERSNFWSLMDLGSFGASRERSWHKTCCHPSRLTPSDAGRALGGSMHHSWSHMKPAQGKKPILTQGQNLLLSTFLLAGQLGKFLCQTT